MKRTTICMASITDPARRTLARIENTEVVVIVICLPYQLHIRPSANAPLTPLAKKIPWIVPIIAFEYAVFSAMLRYVRNPDCSNAYVRTLYASPHIIYVRPPSVRIRILMLYHG